MTINLDNLRKRAELPNALHGCTSNPCGSVVCQTARDRDELLSRVEQAEENLESALEANKRWAHRSSRERSELFKAEQTVARVREVVGEDAPSFFTNEAMHAYDKAMSEITRALDGDGRE